MALYQGRTAKYTRSARFTPHELAAFKELKEKYRRPQTRRSKKSPPNLYHIGERFWLPNGAWKLKRIVGGYMSLEELDALGRAIRKSKKRQPKIIEISQGAFMEHVARNKSFLEKVEQAAEDYRADCEDAYRELMCASRVNRPYRVSLIVPEDRLSKTLLACRMWGAKTFNARWQGTLSYIRVYTTWEKRHALETALEIARAA